MLPRVASHLAMIGETAPWKPLWISIYNAKCLTLDDYRHGRVLFAGDAAHLVPIFGVRGLNSGLDDAGNLAWKLAAVVRGRASPGLLDSYTVERLHAARENIAYGAKSTEFMAPPHFGFRLMREATLRLATESAAVRSLINPRQSSPVAYPPVAGPPVGVAHALVGRPVPDAPLAGDPAVGHVSELFGAGFVALLFTDAPVPADAGAAPPSRDLVVRRLGRAATDWDRYDAVDGTTLLVRPDGYAMACWPRFDPVAIDAAIRGCLDRPGTADG